MKKALWITLGVRGNAGDALIYEVTRALFDGLIELDFRTVGEPRYIRRGQRAPDNVIIGPGGVLVRTNSARHLQTKITRQWDQFRASRFFIWSSGILEKPLPEEVPVVRDVLRKSERIVVRAAKEAELIRSVVPEATPTLLPCASLFTDRLLRTQARRRDLVVVNLDSFLFTDENIEDHPLKRFRDYARSEGLEVGGMVNAFGDSNRHSIDLFPLIDEDREVFTDLLSTEPSSKEFNEPFTRRLQRVTSFGDRYASARFAFGKRLHGWLPFLAFDTPAAFIGMEARRRMPQDYFGTNEFLCAVPRRRDMSREELDEMANAMIGKLNYFIKNEDALRGRIAARREELWSRLSEQARDFAAALT